MEDKWLIGLDIDGTLVHDDGFLSDAVVEQVQRVRSLGHEVFIATGRAAGNAYPVIKDLGIDNSHAVCSNGAVTIKVDKSLPMGSPTPAGDRARSPAPRWPIRGSVAGRAPLRARHEGNCDGARRRNNRSRTGHRSRRDK